MKYIFFIAILCHLSFSIESGIYHDIKVYESGIRCENLIENGTLCKKKKFPRIQYREGEEEKVLIYKDLNSKKTYLLIYIKEEEKSVSIPLKKIDVNLYKGEKYLKKGRGN